HAKHKNLPFEARYEEVPTPCVQPPWTSNKLLHVSLKNNLLKCSRNNSQIISHLTLDLAQRTA
ncbi:hypothetical protein, partial [Liquorilactobacillus satsumensis]